MPDGDQLAIQRTRANRYVVIRQCSDQLVRFGNGGGTLDWWLTSAAPGGWVKFTGGANGGDKKDLYTMQMIAKGTGAKSELGIVIK